MDEELIRAHKENNLTTLVALYTKAADEMEKDGNIDAACFYLTHAYIFALDAGSDRVNRLHQRLLDHQRI